ncbi:MAG: class I SAM-dependent methyltransferase [Parvibaculaceae bacterium]
MDVTDLREFYGSRLGDASRRIITHKLSGRLGNLAQASVLGLGYAMPYLDAVSDKAGRVIAFTLAQRGVLHWPADGRNATCLVDECDLPLLESTVDFALVVHGLELTDHPADMLREIWRVLSPQGRLVMVVTNRRGMWAQSDATPFGYGQPYSRPQLQQVLKDAGFSPTGWAQALFLPPVERGFVLKSAPVWERVGLYVSAAFSGVIIVEAVKQVYAINSGKRVKRAVPRLKPALASFDPG